MDLNLSSPPPGIDMNPNKNISPMTLLVFLVVLIAGVTYTLYPDYKIVSYLLFVLAGGAFWKMIHDGKPKEKKK
ncbi:MAG: hypothetical protein CO030_01555 [Candidatus Magasanikbacteria bacterium CG_4_9_14_0_2_um_filter_42_11]|uniref:Uncharacterized protein n=1 Tax=Candidatus Magasanikbacteria bacterium CG_4_9_14_0_2_um_filter_42_11 TaxID=1974643 RepID=A0A2M8FAJ3_9BACT|nr:MAG: hypothetical protein COU34_03035 [Candidatus Magasanikbacteria bacterium CG10_big_fil_rev_8_21_14_0_10_43_9]PIY92492.1 MAG: hypothetical protein COY70_02965 [Candidatus Magasanikbacteria bacterium CG_4_10_14_0_8_um_filter_42_12]PJC52689.1 MAG: hypothetical protein CO030_01555 [Candidatus Magasanikbacteria bacterium CG_4_9_14_0_2_um_filter_42_11]